MNKVDQLYKAMSEAMDNIDDNMSYVVFALAVAKLLKEEYGEHNFSNFQETLKYSLTE